MADVHGWRAADAPETRRWLRRRWTAVVVAAVLAVVLIVVGAVDAMGAGNTGMPATDRRTSATITAVETQIGGATGPSISLTFTFSTGEGQPQTATVQARPTRDLVVGAPITVQYDAAHPNEVQLIGQSADGSTMPWFVPLVLGIGLIGVALVTSFRLRWAGRVVRDNPWVVAESQTHAVIGQGLRRYVLRTLELRGAPEEGLVQAQPLSWRARALDQFAPQAWVAGSERRFVVAAPGGAPLLRFRRVRVLDRAHDTPVEPLRSRLDAEQKSATEE